MPRFCTSCGAEVAESAVFCPACGKSVPAGASATTPGSPATAPGPAVSTTGAGLSDNVAGLLAYLLIPAIIFLFVEPYNRNKFVRFHSFQSIFYEVAWIVINVALNIVWRLVLEPLNNLVSLLFFAGWVIMAVKAYQGEMLKLPIIGDLAEKQANG